MTTIRICIRSETGIDDDKQDFGLEDFGGVIPSIGDTILDPGVWRGLDRQRPENRRVWTVVGRIFNPRDTKDYVSLVVERRAGTMDDLYFI